MLSSIGNYVCSRIGRFRPLALILLVSFVYTLSQVLWDSEELEYEDLALEAFFDLNDADEPQLALPNSRHMYLPLVYNASFHPENTSFLAPCKVPTSCLESLFNLGEIKCKSRKISHSIDVVWTWVNASDPIWRLAHDTIESKVQGQDGKTKMEYKAPINHLRDYDELRHSMRSVFRYFQPHVRDFHLIASDFEVPDFFRSEYNLTEDYRLGQLPLWLDSSKDYWQDNNVHFSVHHHSTFFSQYRDTVFSSFTIESQLRHLQGVTNVFVYLNDDMYLLKDLHPADFYTSAYGFVFRMDVTLHVPPELELNPKRGEWQPLRETNIVLSKRFGYGERPYVTHMAKVMSIPILREMAASFPAPFARTGARLFREVWHNEPGDVHTAFMLPQYVVERWREALLWSWVVARLGGDDDSWSAEAAWSALGGGEESSFLVGGIQRATLDTDRVLATLRKTGYGPPGGTDYTFASGDGYPFYAIRRGAKENPDQESAYVCTLARDECFPPDLTAAGVAFQHLAFAKPECGDCVINRLVQRSGSLGLSEFLPPSDRKFTPAARGPTPQTLPIVSEWSEGNFALADVLHQGASTIDVREWTMHVLNRYRFVLGNTPSEFIFLNGPAAASRGVAKLKPESDIALACMNDDATGNADKISQIMRDWQSERWPMAARWEHP